MPLTSDQKIVIINYVMGCSAKAIFEDCEEFYEPYENGEVTADDIYHFVEEAKQYILDTL